MKFWIAHTVSGFRFRCCSHCFVRGSCFISVLYIYVRATVTWCVSSVKQEQPTLSEISLILWVRVWFSVSCFVDICLYFCPLAITLPTLLRITPLLSSKYSGGNSTFIVCSFAHVHSNVKLVHLTFKSFVYSPLDNIHTSHSKRTA